ncbi:MAG: hypothetical protein COY66_05055 [Candidatus Kerfeldbacteria bacterium CG_4_10_14_0_8_um_filter_42_10]|uniref:Uncharacterized protein n=1 Tax=Candidatus Kerfeldbacteria bacterium CG_4_10_14_0_8_um_filter_42_10 TaxID=2014248 RepID=A0A2M7RHA6_9BACT|nr:MAG: hypothetical protein COY66_05055 [Candidatus Kerfeldbacteria bacterium CG_4_10_14_0_8_um_filter_42_10]
MSICNISDKQELERLKELKRRGVDGSKLLKEMTDEFDPETGALRIGNIRLDKFNLSDDEKLIMGELIKEGNDYTNQRRGVMSWEQTEALAQELEPKLKMKSGQTLNAEQLNSLAGAVGGLTKKAYIAAQTAATEPTEINLAISQGAREELNMALASLSGAKSEWGRAGSIQRKLNEAIMSRDAKLIRQALKLGTSKFKEEDIVSLVSKLDPNDYFGQYRFLDGLRKPQMGDYIMELWYNSILSGPLTHIRNFVGNTSNLIFEASTKPFASLYDFTRSAITKNERSIRIGEVGKDVFAGFSGLRDGLGKAFSIMKNGFTIDDAVKLELRNKQAFKGGLGTIVNVPSRLLQASDTLTRAYLMSNELYGQAYSKAKNLKLKGVQLRNKVAELMANPSPEMMRSVHEWATRNVFQEDGTKFIKSIGKLRGALDIKGIKPITFIVPFVETPGNLVKVGLRATPLGIFNLKGSPLGEQILKNKYKTEEDKFSQNRKSAQNFGRAILGSLIMAGMATWAASGNITGQGPTDKKERDALYRIGWKPQSIKVPGMGWISYKNITPLNIPLSILGNMIDGYIYDDVAPDTQGLTTLFLSEIKSISDQSFFQGINGFINAIYGTDQERQNYFSRFATSIIPQAYQQTMRIYDPTIYSTSTFGDAMKRALGLNDGLSPKYDALGNKITGQRASGLPFFPSKETISPTEQKLIDLGVQYLSPPPDRIGKRKMTDEEYSEFTRKVGEELNKELLNDRKLPRDLSSDKAQDEVDDIRAKIYKDVRNEMFPDNKNEPLTFNDNSVQNPNTVLDNVVLYAKAVGTDPVTAFNYIFSGQKIRRIDNKTIIVERMTLKESEKIKQQLGSTPEMRLDHIVPLELGGSNGRNNLQLIPEEKWASFTRSENHLGKLLREGKIEKSKAQKMIKEFKQGKIKEKDILNIK